MKDKINELKQKQLEDTAITRRWRPISGASDFRGNIEEISAMSRSEHKPIKAETNVYDQYVIIAPDSNFYDTGISLVEQSNKIKQKSNKYLSAQLKMDTESQKKYTMSDVAGTEEFFYIAVTKEMFKRPELREQIDLMQTLRLYNIIGMTSNPENRELLYDIEADLQQKAWKYFAGEKTSKEQVHPTPYAVSYLDDLKEYMVETMHAPESIVEPKLKELELAMLSSIEKETIQPKSAEKQVELSGKRLSGRAVDLAYKTAKKYPEHKNSQQIIKEATQYKSEWEARASKWLEK
ncbi:MAG: hypothetical protein J6T72_02705 [Alphaproteobacteria bacterium]|nr:hypothetical protein [Alphaproteobacteria bacterium]